MTRARLRAGVAAGVAGVLLSLPATGQTPEAGSPSAGVVDTIHVSWQIDRLSGAVGRGGSMDLVHAVTGGSVYTVGGAAFGVADSRWGFGRLGFVARPTSRFFVGGGARVGRGTETGSGFRYLSLRAQAGYRLSDRVTLSTEDEYLDVAESRGHLVKLGSQLLIAPSASLSASYATSAGGNLDTRFVQGRLDLVHGPFRIFGGGAGGRSTPGVIDLGLGVHTPAQALRQGFVGATVPLRTSRLTLTVDRLALDRVSRLTFTLSVSFSV